MKKRIVIIIIATFLLLFIICSLVFKDFIFAKNEIFLETGTSIHLVYAPPFEIKNTTNRFYIRKVQNLIEKSEKEIIDTNYDKKGWKIRGSITVEGKYYDINLVGQTLRIGDTTYKIKDKQFTEKLKSIFDKIKNPT